MRQGLGHVKLNIEFFSSVFFLARLAALPLGRVFIFTSQLAATLQSDADPLGMAVSFHEEVEK